MPIIEVSSGSTAVSEAYFARLLCLPFIAVVPECTARRKIEQIEHHAGRCHFVSHGGLIYDEAKWLAREPFPQPSWMVMSAGTSATLGSYIRYHGHSLRLMVVDPENFVFHAFFRQRDPELTHNWPSRIEGIGRPRVEPSFIPDVIDEMMIVPNGASIAKLGWLETLLGRRVGGSTGTKMWCALQLAKRMRAAGEAGTIVTLLCDGGERYATFTTSRRG